MPGKLLTALELWGLQTQADGPGEAENDPGKEAGEDCEVLSPLSHLGTLPYHSSAPALAQITFPEH